MVTITSGAERFLRDASAKAIRLGYEPFPKQQQFHASPAKYRLFGGAAGPGKTKALLMEAILQAHDHPGANTLLLRRTFPELEQSLLLYFRRDVPRELYKSFNESKHVVTWQNNSTTRFGYCQSESDVYQYQGAEFLFIGIDELTLFTLRQWQFLTSRNRCPIANSFPCMAGATNPGNIGHAWVKSLWIDRQPAPGMENASEYDPADYDFIAARVSDNPVYAADENYLKTLRALPTHLRRAFLDGNWDVFAGQYFDNFDCSRHVIRAESIRGPQVAAEQGSRGPGEGRSGDQSSLGDQWERWWPRWISIDWGFEHPAAVYWHCAIPGGSRSAGFQPAVSHSTVADPCRDEAHSSPAPVVSAHVECGGLPAEKAGLPPLYSPRCAEGQHDPARLASPGDGDNESPDFSLPNSDAASCAHPGNTPRQAGEANSGAKAPHSTGAANSCVVTYREYVTRRTTPRDLAREIVSRSVGSVEARGFSPANSDMREALSDLPGSTNRRPGSPSWLPQAVAETERSERHRAPASGIAEKIDAIYLSPDAFANRTGEASIAEQMGDIFAAAGLPRPVPADDDRVGGWMLMYQMLASGEWLLADNCFELIRTLPSLVRDPVRVEDIEKCDGDDPADAARYGLKSRYAAHRGDPGGWRSRMPLADRIAAHTYSADPTIRAMQSRKFTLEESRGHGPQRIPFRHRGRH